MSARIKNLQRGVQSAQARANLGDAWELDGLRAGLEEVEHVLRTLQQARQHQHQTFLEVNRLSAEQARGSGDSARASHNASMAAADEAHILVRSEELARRVSCMCCLLCM